MPNTLITVADLAAHLQDPSWLVLDLRHDLADPQAGRAAFEQGHIPGSQHVNLDTDLSGARRERTSPGGQRHDGGRHPLPSPEALRLRLQQLGVGDGTQVVAADAQGGMYAARLWWLLRWIGHAQVAVLDGGVPAWQAAGHELETGEGTPRKLGQLTHRPSLTRLADIDTVFANLQTQALQVVDARAPDRFRGENETLDPVGGHIPGAVNRFFRDNLAADGRFKSADELRAEWSPIVADPAQAVMQCGSGVTACHNLLALEVAGLGGAALYAGSWSDWVSDPSRPVAKG
ncbi:MAG: sulfurtransferase [Aquabacterium sp.]|nr:MAG: sulfurtransferase [Aquabacterium sp.]